MTLLKLSLRTRIFITMTLLVLVASILIAAVTIYQYKEEAEEYHQDYEKKHPNHPYIVNVSRLKIDKVAKKFKDILKED